MNIQILPGYMLGQYEIRDFLGAGSMGAVYRGYQLNLKRDVAIKVLPAMLAMQPGYVQRFNREAETVAKLEHAHIIPIYDFGMVDSVAYIVMRLLTGGTLYERLHQQMVEKGVMPSFGEVAGLLRQLAGALDYAHNRGVIHRDIKPNNVMFDNQGFAFITDFGLAKITDTTSSLTGSNSIVGTPTYMSPEQWRSEEVVPATDQYAVGVMIYALVTGRLPF
jgi:serine/threonine protein kinase